MCLAIPGRITQIIDNEFANVDFKGITRKVNVSLVCANVNDYVVVHAGFAIGVMDREHAEEIYSLIECSGRTNLNG